MIPLLIIIIVIVFFSICNLAIHKLWDMVEEHYENHHFAHKHNDDK